MLGPVIYIIVDGVIRFVRVPFKFFTLKGQLINYFIQNHLVVIQECIPGITSSESSLLINLHNSSWKITLFSFLHFLFIFLSLLLSEKRANGRNKYMSAFLFTTIIIKYDRENTLSLFIIVTG